jgi:PAS domain S-box-containing protein
MSVPYLQVLLIEDNPGDAILLREMLLESAAIRFELVHVERLDQGLEQLARKQFDVILLDLSLPDSQGLSTLNQVYQRASTIPIVVLTGLDDEAVAVKAAQVGAQEYLIKDQINSRLVIHTLRYAIERKRVEQQLRLQAAALESAANGIVITDRDGVVVWTNPAFTDLTGYSGPEMVGENTRILKSGQHSPSFYQKMWDTILAGEVWHGELINRRKDGQLYVEEMTITPVRDFSSRITHFIAIKQDVTQRKRAEKELRTQKQMFENLVEVARATAERPSLESTLESALEIALNLTSADLGSLVLFDQKGGFQHSVLAREKLTPEQHRDIVCLTLEDGLAHWVARNHQAILSNDINQDERWRVLPGIPYLVQAVLSVPILSGNKVLGVLTLTHSTASFEREDVELMQAATNQMALALQNAQMYEEQRRQADRQSTLYQVLRSVGGHLDSETVAQVAVETVATLTNWPAVALFQPDRIAGDILIQTATGLLSQVEGSYLPTDQTIEGEALQTAQPQYCADLDTEPQYVRALPAIRSALAVPLRRGERVLGILGIESDQKDALDDDEILLAESLAEAIALAMDNARLYTAAQHELALQRRAERLELVNRIARAVSATLNLDDLVETVHQQVATLFQSDLFLLALYDQESAELDCRLVVEQGVRKPPQRLELGTGRIAWIIDNREALLIQSAEEKEACPPLDLKIAAIENYVSWLGVPMSVGDRVIGVITTQSCEPHTYGKEEELLLNIIADQVAAAVENARLYEEVSQQREQLRALGARLAETQEAERQHLARELHDQIGQNLTALGINLNIVRAQMPMADHSRLDDTLALVEQTTDRIRNVMAELRPPVLDDYGLVAALHWYADRFASRTGITVVVRGQEPTPRLDPSLENALFRIAQEALNNVAKHAHAKQVTILMEVLDEAIRMNVADDGIGFDPASSTRADGRHGWGLLSMRERAEAVGGHCSVESAPHQGTRVIVEVGR